MHTAETACAPVEMGFLRGVIVGSGSSGATPALGCITGPTPCGNCAEAHRDPRRSKNHRLNVSFLVQLRHPADGSLHNVLIDCGKTFREAALKVFPAVGVSDLSAVLLTHDHADAAFGLDDLREFNRPDTSLNVFADERTEASMRRVYPYLFPKDGPPKVGEWRQKKTGFVASLAWHVFTPLQKLLLSIRDRTPPNGNGEAVMASWPIVPIAVPHGGNYLANAFLLPMHLSGEKPRLLLYVSDMSELEDKFFTDLTQAKELLGVPGSTSVEVLLLDMLSHRTYFSHLSVDASIAAARRIQAGKTYFVGMSHLLNHDELTRELQGLGLSSQMEVGFDGCVVCTAEASDAQRSVSSEL
ncbi:PhnP protein [Trypanosoma conorhini]|uniref:PhnP protein n=1 Tax=Trypanosoma conorhini TaxID=83891 RepID=A0A3R7LMI2_9TRYP|nr:PhnP protein [Trypanosoma conorhini]RNF27590.1 PhnP protein [Trypanosoma conorhini]